MSKTLQNWSCKTMRYYSARRLGRKRIWRFANERPSRFPSPRLCPPCFSSRFPRKRFPPISGLAGACCAIYPHVHVQRNPYSYNSRACINPRCSPSALAMPVHLSQTCLRSWKHSMGQLQGPTLRARRKIPFLHSHMSTPAFRPLPPLVQTRSLGTLTFK